MVFIFSSAEHFYIYVSVFTVVTIYCSGNAFCFSLPSSIYHCNNAARRWDTNDWTPPAYTVNWLAEAEINLHWKVCGVHPVLQLLDSTIICKYFQWKYFNCILCQLAQRSYLWIFWSCMCTVSSMNWENTAAAAVDLCISPEPTFLEPCWINHVWAIVHVTFHRYLQKIHKIHCFV